MYLVLRVSNCSEERSFSKMKLIKDRLHMSICTDRFLPSSDGLIPTFCKGSPLRT